MQNDKGQIFNLQALEQAVLMTVFSIGIVSIVTTLLAMSGMLYLPVIVLLLVPLYFFLSSTFLFSRDIFTKYSGYFHTLLLILLFFTLFSHFLGVLLPEVGFDALWYHLPTIKEYVTHHRLVYDDRWYQTLYPQFGDLFFSLGFTLFSVLGAKLLNYGIMCLIGIVVYLWSRQYLHKTESLSTVIVVLLFHVVAWQSSSVYVDLYSSLFFLGGSYLAVKKDKIFKSDQQSIWLAAFFFGIFLGTKFINLAFIPLIVCLLFYQIFRAASTDKLKAIIVTVSIFLGVGSFWYLRAWVYTGNLFYPVGSTHADPVIKQMGVDGWSEWLWLRAGQLYLMPIEFFLKPDGYTTVLFLLFLPIVLLQFQRVLKEYLILAVIGLYGLFFWFFFPPPSIRYILGPVIILWILWSIVTWRFARQKKWLYRAVQLAVLVSLLLYLNRRVFINTRGLPYIWGQETQEQYLDRFREGFLDEKIDGFYLTLLPSA